MGDEMWSSKQRWLSDERDKHHLLPQNIITLDILLWIHTCIPLLRAVLTTTLSKSVALAKAASSDNLLSSMVS